jgi:PKHD-type hydroxylase
MLFARYSGGQTYGAHVDDAIMGGDRPMRTDVSVTVFLVNADQYEGGELVMDQTGGETSYKLNAGDVIASPSNTLHEVKPVTGGTRTVAVTWVQSMVRDPAHREILFDLDTARRRTFQAHGKTREFDLMSKSHANLMRMWAEV